MKFSNPCGPQSAPVKPKDYHSLLHQSASRLTKLETVIIILTVLVVNHNPKATEDNCGMCPISSNGKGLIKFYKLTVSQSLREKQQV